MRDVAIGVLFRLVWLKVDAKGQLWHAGAAEGGLQELRPGPERLHRPERAAAGL